VGTIVVAVPEPSRILYCARRVMTLEEAASILEITLPCPRKEARKAYLRLVKVHKPERDPEGFRRVREAWECLERAGDPIGESLRVERFDFGEAIPSIEAVTSSSVPLPLDPEASPDEPDAYWMRHAELVDDGRMDEAAALLRAAHERGFPGFFDELVAGHVEALTDHELTIRAKAPGAHEHGVLATELARRGLFASAVEVALFAFSYDLGDRVPWLGTYYRLYFTLVGAGAVPEAERLRASLEVEERRRDRRSIPASIAGLPADALMREVVAAGRLPDDVRSAMMNALLDELDPRSVAKLELVALDRPEMAEGARYRLEKNAPMLYALFGDSLRTKPGKAAAMAGEPASGPASWFRSAGVWAASIVFARAVIAILGGDCGSSSEPAAERLITELAAQSALEPRPGEEAFVDPAVDAGAVCMEPQEETDDEER
jgi:hypothetical protein